jgi:beta-lactamase class A
MMMRSLVAALALAVAGPTLAAAPDAALQTALQRIADQARPGTFGIIVMDATTGQAVRINDSRPYLMMSVFKAPVAAVVLSQVDAGRLRLDQTVTVGPADVVPGSAAPSVGARAKAGAVQVTVQELLEGAVSKSDNTAVDVLIRLLGGPQVPHQWLRQHGLGGMHIDTDERGLSAMFDGVKPGGKPPAHETKSAERARLQAGYDAVMQGKVNTTTLDAAATFLTRLQAGELLSPASTQRLLAMMTAQTIPNRIRAGLPAVYGFADKTGTAFGGPDDRMAARNDIGIVTAPDGTRWVVAAFLTDAPTTSDKANPWFAEIGRQVAAAMQR